MVWKKINFEIEHLSQLFDDETKNIVVAELAKAREVEGGDLQCPFLKIKKKCPDLKKAYIVAIYGIIFSFKNLF